MCLALCLSILLTLLRLMTPPARNSCPAVLYMARVESAPHVSVDVYGASAAAVPARLFLICAIRPERALLGPSSMRKFAPNCGSRSISEAPCVNCTGDTMLLFQYAASGFSVGFISPPLTVLKIRTPEPSPPGCF